MKIYVNNVKVKLYLQLEKIYHTKKKRNADHFKLLSRKLELENDQVYNYLWILQSHSKCCFWRMFDNMWK